VRAPDLAYHFVTRRDTAGPTFETFSRALTLTANLATLNLTVEDIPQDRVLVVSNIVIQATPTAGLILTTLSTRGFTQAGAEFRLAIEIPDAVITLTRRLNWQGDVFIQGRSPNAENLRMTANFNGAGATNTISAWVHGIVIPRGNIAGF